MNRKLTMLCAVALIIVWSPVFAEEGAPKGDARGQRTKIEKTDGAHPGQMKGTGLAKKAQKAKVTAYKATKEEIGKETVCPVTGDKFKVAAGTPAASYKGKIYYFCCSDCEKSFRANPEKYAMKKQAPEAKVYICPMGDYQGDKPGKCPKCGMDLVEKK